MPQTTTLRRASTFVVGALFAIVFVFSGVSAAQAATTHLDPSQRQTAGSAHTATSKAAVRTVEHHDHELKQLWPAPLDLTATGPADADNSPGFAADAAGESPAAHRSSTLFTTSERAPPAR